MRGFCLLIPHQELAAQRRRRHRNVWTRLAFGWQPIVNCRCRRSCCVTLSCSPQVWNDQGTVLGMPSPFSEDEESDDDDSADQSSRHNHSAAEALVIPLTPVTHLDEAVEEEFLYDSCCNGGK